MDKLIPYFLLLLRILKEANRMDVKHFPVIDLAATGNNIRRLRLKVEDDPQNPTCITTVWGYGYKWGI